MARRYVYQMNRAVGIMNKGDKFQAEPDDPAITSLVGAGYADLVLVQDNTKAVGEDDGDPVRREPDYDSD